MTKAFFLVAALVGLGAASQADARPFRLAQVPNGSAVGAGCNLCHTSGGGTPRNAFGLAVEAIVGGGDNVEFWSAELAALDSDGDGVPNGAEVGDAAGTWMAGDDDPALDNITHPGDESSFDPSAIPTATAVENSTWGQIKGLAQQLSN